MLALYIILGILLFLFLITLFNIYVHADYDNELSLFIKIAFVKITILPPKPKKEKPEKKPKKKKKNKEKTDEKPKNKEPNKVFSYVKQKGISGIVNIVQRISSLAIGVLKDFFSHLVIDELYVDLRIAGDTAEDAAVKYGRICSVFFPALRLIIEIVKVKHYDVNVNPDFNENAEDTAKAKVVARIRILALLKIVVTRAFAALRLFIKAKPKKIKKK